jgi:hypothetical protein
LFFSKARAVATTSVGVTWSHCTYGVTGTPDHRMRRPSGSHIRQARIRASSACLRARSPREETPRTVGTTAVREGISPAHSPRQRG